MPSASPVRRSSRPTATLAPPDAARNGNGAALATTAQSNTIAGLLTRPDVKEQIKLALPQHGLTADRLARIALTEVRKNPKLAQCDQASFLGAIMQCAQLGLEPGSALGHAYLLPFENRQKRITEVQFIVGYRGMIDLARRSGQILSLEARAVYEADEFHVELGLNPDLRHVPAWDVEDRGELQFVYAVAKLKDGGTQFDVMSRADIDRIRKRSKASTSGPWVTDYEAMAKKTIIRQLFKYLPVSIELATAVDLDQQADKGQQENPLGYLASAAPAADALPSSNGNGAAPALPQAQAEPVVSAQQVTQIETAIVRKLSVIGEAALLAELAADEGIERLEDLPVSRFDPLFRQLATTAVISAWNEGKASTGEPILSQEQINEIVDADRAAQEEAAAEGAAKAQPAAQAEPTDAAPAEAQQATFV
jgi:recombination protein RecT